MNWNLQFSSVPGRRCYIWKQWKICSALFLITFYFFFFKWQNQLYCQSNTKPLWLFSYCSLWAKTLAQEISTEKWNTNSFHLAFSVFTGITVCRKKKTIPQVHVNVWGPFDRHLLKLRTLIPTNVESKPDNGQLQPQGGGLEQYDCQPQYFQIFILGIKTWHSFVLPLNILLLFNSYSLYMVCTVT